MEIKKDEIRGILFEIVAVTFFIALTFIAALILR
jgi:hypothetical protein